MEIYDAEILVNKNVSLDTFEMHLKCNSEVSPGEFINIKIDDTHLLRRPISIMDSSDGIIKIAYRVKGEGTEILSQKKPKDIVNILTRLGNGFPLYKEKKCLLVGGGIGVFPLIFLARKLKMLNAKLTIVLSFRNRESILYADSFKEFGDVFISTDDGSYGIKGNALDVLNEKNFNFDIVYACGPTIMLKKIDEKYQGIKEGYISFEERMACGIGVCYGCVCKPKKLENGMLRVCKEGPVFSLGVIDYD